LILVVGVFFERQVRDTGIYHQIKNVDEVVAVFAQEQESIRGLLLERAIVL
jgi:hypothetical protein